MFHLFSGLITQFPYALITISTIIAELLFKIVISTTLTINRRPCILANDREEPAVSHRCTG